MNIRTKARKYSIGMLYLLLFPLILFSYEIEENSPATTFFTKNYQVLKQSTNFNSFRTFLNPSQNQAVNKKKTVVMMEDCFNELDDDGDGLIDCYDDDCAGVGVCDSFIYQYTALPNCQFVPPTIDSFKIEKLYKTNELTFPIDQRSGVFIGDMDGDGIPDMVAKDPSPGRIQIYNGADGTIKQSIIVPTNHPFSQPAIADVDRNGLGDIFITTNTNQLARYEYGNVAAVWNTANNIGTSSTHCSPQVADFDHDGTPEVYVGNRVFDAITGTRLAIGTGSLGKAFDNPNSNHDKWPIAFDVFAPGDPKPGGGVFGPEAQGLELIAGNNVYTYTPGNGTQDNGSLDVVSAIGGGDFKDGFTSVADVDGDNLVDIVLMSAGKIYIWNPRTQMQIGSTYDIPGTNTGGRINIGDFDNDGMVEIGTAGRNIYVVLEYDAASNSLVTKWQKTGLDDGSQRTGSTLFDFDGDGANEVVYSEEGHLYVWRGSDGAELVKVPAEAGTRTEYPIVADVNNDGAAEIIITAQNGNGPGFSGNDYVCVYQSLNTPWVSARQVWNQHGYFVTNINDDLTVPIQQQNPLDSDLNNAYNGFLVQTTILNANGGSATPAFAAPDACAKIDSITPEQCPNLVVHVTIKNKGSQDLPATTPISFYDQNPTAGTPTLLGTSTIGTTLLTDDSTSISVVLDIAPLCAPIEVFSVINDPGTNPVPYSFGDFPLSGVGECDFNNNLDSLMSPICIEICGDGIDNDKDGVADEPNIMATDTSGCPNTTLPAFTTDEAGGTWSIISDIGSTITNTGVVTLGTYHSPTPNIDTVIYVGGLCSDTILISTFDEEAPVLSCPTDQALMANTSCMVAIPDYTGLASVSDNCSATVDITLTQSPISGTMVGLGTTVITIIATDEAGNQTTCQFNLMVTDDINPSITCPANTNEFVDANCDFKLLDYTSLATVSDNCSMAANITVTQNPAIGTTISGHNMMQVITLTAKDESGNTANCTFTVTLLDNIPPTISCPADISINADADCEVAIGDYISQATVTDNCTSSGAITVTQSPAPSTLLSGHGDSEMITLTADDGNGNTTTCTFTVTLEDVTPPVLTCPSDQVLAVDTNCEIIVPNYTSMVTKTDNCTADASIILTQSPAAGTVINTLNSVVTITITGDDTNGNTSNCTFSLTLEDEINPTITCPSDVTVALDANCQATIADYTSMATIADNCTSMGDLTVSQSPSAGQVITSPGTTTITLTVTDESGNTAQCTFDVTYEDNINPTITCPANDILGVDGTCAIPLPDYTGNATYSDNCSINANLTITQSPVAGTMIMGDGFTQVVTLTVVDESGNMAQCTFTVSLQDITNPSITCPGDENLHADNNCQVLIPDYTGAAVVSTNCAAGSSVTVTQSPVANTLLSGHGASQTITLTATDASGNSSQCTFVVTVKDTINPILTCPTDLTLYTDANCENVIPDLLSGLAYSDNCTATGSLSPVQSPTAGTTISGENTSYTVTFTLADGNGNQSQCSMTVELIDTTAPTLVCIGNQTLYANAGCMGTIPNYIPQISITDDCAAANEFTISQNPIAGTTLSGHNDSENVVITVTDNSGNTSTCTFEVILKDTIAPQISCPANQQIVANANCQIVIPDYTNMASISDNCTIPSAITVTQQPAIGTVLSNLGASTTITLTADDGNGNLNTCTFSVSLIDETPPVFTCPVNQTVYLDISCGQNLLDYRDSITVMDNCSATGNLVLTQLPAPNTPISQHDTEISVTLEATDENNNTTTCSFKVILKDTIPPSITCPSDKVMAVDANCAFEIPDWRSEIVTTDNCSATNNITITQSPIQGTIISNHNTTQTITFTANDGNGNTSTCSILLTIKDSINPVILCPANQSINVGTDCEIMVPDYTNSATISDNCANNTAISVTQSPIAGTVLSGSETEETITLYANDGNGNGNIDSCKFQLALTDTIPPVIVCPATQTIIMDGNCEFLMPDYTGMSTYNDNCLSSGVTITQNPAPGTLLSGTDSVFFTFIIAEDFDGNLDSCDFLVVLKDTLKPVLTCIGNQTVYLDENCLYEVEDFTGTLTVTDNCSNTTDIETLQFPPEGVLFTGINTNHTITLAVIDQSGNETQCNFDLTLLDTIPPVLTCPDTQYIDVNGICSITIPDYTGAASIDDNCSIDANITITQSPINIPLSGDGTIQDVTLTATDESGNSTTCNFKVMLVDRTSPMISCPGDQLIHADANCQATIPDYTNQTIITNDCEDIANITVTQNPSPGTIMLSGFGSQQDVTIIVTDQSGNKDSCDFTVSVIDTIPPMVTCLGSDTLYLDACFSEIPNYTDLIIASDNCTADSDIIISQSIQAGQLIIEDHNGVRIITIYAQDEANNFASCQFPIVFVDTFPPYVECPSDTMIYMDETCEIVVPDYRNYVINQDNCADLGEVTVVQDPFPGTVLQGSDTTYVVTITADDSHGNESTCDFNIILEDTISPVIICPDTQTVFLDGRCESVLGDYTSMGIISDNCSSTPKLSVTQIPIPGTIISIPNIPQPVQLIVDDGNGNTDTCTFEIIHLDTIVPEIICPADQILMVDDDCPIALPDYTNVMVDDNCSAMDKISITQNPVPGTLVSGHGNTTTITLTATDWDGNSNSCSFKLTHVDKTPPKITCPDTQKLVIDDNCQAMLPDYTALGNVMSTCQVSNFVTAFTFTVEQYPAPGTIVGGINSLHEILLIAKDPYGNADTCAFNVALFVDFPDLYVRENVPIETPVEICLDHPCVSPGSISAYTKAGTSTGVGQGAGGIFQVNPTTGCVIYEVGAFPASDVDSFCIVVCDENICCDTINYQIEIDNYQAFIVDPCVCLDNATGTNSGDGQFYEYIKVTSPSNEVWPILSVTGFYQNPAGGINIPTSGGALYPLIPVQAGSAPFIEVPRGNGISDYYLGGLHVEGQGYTLTVANRNDTLTVSNICDYPCRATEFTPDGIPPPDAPPIGIIQTRSKSTIAQNTLTSCEGTSFSNYTVHSLYVDTAACRTAQTICPTNQWQRLKVTFNEFDLADGDALCVFEGKDTVRSLIARWSGTGVSQTGGWITANCDPDINPSGCLTFLFKTNGDNSKALGWRSTVTCEERDIVLKADDLQANLACDQTHHVFTIRPATVESECTGLKDSQFVRIYNSHGELCHYTCLAINRTFDLALAIGQYKVEYTLKSDSAKTTSATISVQETPIVCNDEVTIPMGSACSIAISPDDLLENPCDTITDTVYYFITLKGIDKNGQETVLASGGGKGGNYPVITKEMIDQCSSTIKATIEKRYYEGVDLDICNNGTQLFSCTVKVNIKDELAPVFGPLASNDTLVACNLALTQNGLGLTTPDAVDNCGTATVTFGGAQISTPSINVCDTTRAIISWIATDECGNTATATQQVVIIRPQLADIVKTDEVILTCDNDAAIDESATIPSIKTGRLKNGMLEATDTIALSTTEYICGYILQYTDTQIPAVDCGRKIFRNWTVLDWCDSQSGPQAIDTTFITFKDTLAPAFAKEAGTNIVIDLDHQSCTYDVNELTKPVATDNCSTPSVRLVAVARLENDTIWEVPESDWANLDADSFQLSWIAEDACHEQTINDTLTQIILIEDNALPSAVCVDNINLSLGQEEAKLHYRDIDGGSYDACGIATYDISRDEVNWDSTVIFDCNDAHVATTIYLRVTDHKGNQSTCWMTVNVEDKIAPICSDLPDKTGTCEEVHLADFGNSTDTNENGVLDDEWVNMTTTQMELFNTNYGNPNCSDNIDCGTLAIQQQYQLVNKKCGEIAIQRRFRAIDWDGKGRTSNWSSQNITIESEPNWMVVLPPDFQGNCGDNIPSSEVTITNGNCDLLTYEVDEKVFENIEDACLKVVRTFTIINWCNYEASQPTIKINRAENKHGIVKNTTTINAAEFENAGKLEYVQILALKEATQPAMAKVSGTITDWNQKTVENTMVTYTDMTTNLAEGYITNEDGLYNFELTKNKAYSVEPQKNDNPLNGVSTFDLVLITKHILNIKAFDNPYQYIAADANKSGTITAFDMVQIRQLILNIKTEFTNNESWRFALAGQDFERDNPLATDFAKIGQINNLTHDTLLDFVAIKIGDVNGSAMPNSLAQVEVRTMANTFEITTIDKFLKAGETYNVSFATEQLNTIQGYQFTLGYENLKLEKLNSGVAGVENFGLHEMDEGFITTSWNQSAEDSEQYAVGSEPSTVLFNIKFTALKDGQLSEQLNLINRPTIIEAYDQQDNLMHIELTFTTPLTGDEFELFQNQPNPFQHETTIGYYLPSDDEVKLILRDEMGRILKTIKHNGTRGYNKIQIEKEELTSGFIYYQLSTKFGSKVKKMIQLK